MKLRYLLAPLCMDSMIPIDQNKYLVHGRCDGWLCCVMKTVEIPTHAPSMTLISSNVHDMFLSEEQVIELTTTAFVSSYGSN